MTLQDAIAAARCGKRLRIGTFQTGGGAPGVCMHAGFLLAMARLGLYPTHISGTSAGAVAGYIYSGDCSADLFVLTVRDMPPDAVQSPTSPSWLPSWAQWTRSIAMSKPLNNNDHALALMREHGPKSWDDIKVDLRMWSSIVGESGVIRHNLTYLDFEHPWEAAVASMSVPYLLPPMIGVDTSQEHLDGGCVFNAPIVPEWLDTMDHCFLLIAQTRVADRPAATRPTELDKAIRVIRGMMAAQICAAVDAVANHPNCTIIWPDFSDNTGLLTFNPALIDQSDEYATVVLKGA